MSLVDHRAAAHRAEQRASTCRARLQRLQSRVPLTPADADRAREALDAARVRAIAASVRAAARRTEAGGAHRGQARAVPVQNAEHLEKVQSTVREAMDSGLVSLSDLMVAYLALGGSCSRFDVDAHVNGLVQLPRIEAALLDEAASELY